ncbi:hypothetical protein MUK42_36968 [Musa troglodytarum]|uniref:Uncharacterized protein n=1 Tax=Musa troglodytarum TaxID=320322 RepID=A0A9E7EGM2_9LILI|nr:hypothetical protein MUK42_36968 [Musa troglodytarum]
MSDKKLEETISHATTPGVGDDLKRVPEMSTMIGAQIKRELSAGNVTPGLGAAACALEQLPSLQRETKTATRRTPLEESWKRNSNNKVIILATEVD